MSSLTFNVFNVTNRCPVCGGAANAKHHPAVVPAAGPRVHRKCSDCGFTWDEKSARRSL